MVKNIASKIDHTALKPETTASKVEELCSEALEYHFASVCILPVYVKIASHLLMNREPKICTVAGFPLGSTYTDVKVAEIEKCLEHGADEIDVVINIPDMVNGNYTAILKELEQITDICHLNNALLKVIIETALLNEDQKIEACKIVTDSGADYIKTSTGFSVGGATVKDVALLNKHTGKNVKVKASGGIKSAEFVMELIEAGAERIGTSAGLKIIREAMAL